MADHRPDRAAVGHGQDRVGRVAGHAVGGRRTRSRKPREALAAGKGEVELEGRPAIDQRRLLDRQVLEAAVLPAAEVDLAQVVVDLDGQVAGNGRGRLPAALQRAAKAAAAGPAAGCAAARARACSRPAASRGGSVAPTSRPTYSAPGRACRTKTRRWAIARFPNKKSPSLEEDGPCNECNLDLPSKERDEAPSGILTSESSYLPRPSHPTVRTVVILCGVRHRLQWRGRAGFSPASQFQRNRSG